MLLPKRHPTVARESSCRSTLRVDLMPRLQVTPVEVWVLARKTGDLFENRLCLLVTEGGLRTSLLVSYNLVQRVV